MHFPGVRIPIPLVLFLAIAVITGFWWHGTREMEFLTPPSVSKLAEIREKVESSIPRAEFPGNAVSPPAIPIPPPPPPAPPEPPKPVIEIGDLTVPPTLDAYNDQSAMGAAALIELAGLLESKGEFQRTLLAWERVLDSGKPNESQQKSALAAITRLRPTLPDWNTDPKKVITITLNAGAGKKTAKLLKPILEKTAKNLQSASAGILKVSSQVASGKDPKSANQAAPIALWITGATAKTRSTDVLSFTVESPEKLGHDIEKTVFEIIRSYMGHRPAQSPPPAMIDGQTPADAFQHNVTRYFWHELGFILNHPPE